MHRLRAVRRQLQWFGLVQIHHIIPRQHASQHKMQHIHIHHPSNVMFMPTNLGAKHLRLRPHRLIHDGGHVRYNAYVALRLNQTNDARN